METPVMESVEYGVVCAPQVIPEPLLMRERQPLFVTETPGGGFVVMEAVPGAGSSERRVVVRREGGGC